MLKSFTIPGTDPVAAAGDAPARPGEWRLDEGSGATRLAVVAHELRNPLAAILYAVAAMAERPDSPAARGQRAVVERQARRAARLVEDLLDSRAGSLRKLVLFREVVDLAEVVAVATETVGHLVAGRGHYLSVALPAEPLRVFADRLRLEQVVTNLLANAAEHTAPGGQLRLTAEADGGCAVLRVQDDGPGIAPDLLPRLFDLYAQSPGIHGRRPGGLGIGLALVKSLVELHGGRVTATSGGTRRGAEFVVRLPALRPDAVPGGADGILPFPTLRPRTEPS